MSGSGFKTFTGGATLLASEVNGYLMKQTIAYFATTGARDAAITSPEAGMHCFIDGTYDLWQVYNGSAWVTYKARGAGSPESNVTASVGATYERTDGSSGTTLYVKESGTGTTGWTAVTTSTETKVVKSADETVTNNTLQDDNELLFAIGASQTWVWECWVSAMGNAAGVTSDFKFAWTWPSSPTRAKWSMINGADTSAAWDFTRQNTQTVSGTAVAVAGNTVAVGYLMKGVIVNGANAGNVVLQWAQNSTNATGSTIEAGSFLVAQRVA